MRDEVRRVAALGPLPDEDTADEKALEQYEQLLGSISPPLTDEEACALVKLLGPDDCYGLAWTVVHLVETTPGWPLDTCLPDADTEWGQTLRTRLENRSRATSDRGSPAEGEQS